MIILPIGERWALIALLTAFTTPRVTFVALLAGCSFAVCYTGAGRVLRSLPRRRPFGAGVGENLGALTDSGPVATAFAALPVRVPAPAAAIVGGAGLVAALLAGGAGRWWGLAAAGGYALLAGLATRAPLVGRLDWLVPPAFRAAEYAAIAVLAAKVVPDAVGAAYGLVAAIAYHHYDTVYRLRAGNPAPPRALTWAVGGHEGRVLLVAGLAAAGPDVLRGALPVVAAVIAVVVVAESIVFWSRGARPDIDDVPPPAAAAPGGRTGDGHAPRVPPAATAVAEGTGEHR
jgi:hypothetical protein